MSARKFTLLTKSVDIIFILSCFFSFNLFYNLLFYFRTLSLKAAGTGKWMGITGSKFVSDEDMFDNGTNVEANKCRCEGVECQPSGTLNVSSCKYGAPAFVSLPHFYLADKSYRQNITGMKPNKDDHEFLLILEPVNNEC